MLCLQCKGQSVFAPPIFSEVSRSDKSFLKHTNWAFESRDEVRPVRIGQFAEVIPLTNDLRGTATHPYHVGHKEWCGARSGAHCEIGIQRNYLRWNSRKVSAVGIGGKVLPDESNVLLTENTGDLQSVVNSIELFKPLHANGYIKREGGGRNRQNCLSPCRPDLGLEARSVDEPRAVTWVCHNIPFELGPASCRAERVRASARVGR